MANNVNSILSELLKSDSITNIAKTSGISTKNVESILKSALPSLISGANSQSTNTDTKEGFLNALVNHGSKDTSNLSSFFKNIDLEDGAKIVNHLLGNKSEDTSKTAAKASGVDSKDVSKVLSTAAPLLMSVIGKKVTDTNKKDSTSSLAGIASSLLGNSDVGDLLKGFLK